MAGASQIRPCLVAVDPAKRARSVRRMETSELASSETLLQPRFVAIVFSALVYFLGTTMLLPVLPRYVRDTLGGSGVTVGIVVGAFAVSAAAVRPIVGRIGDYRGRRVLVVGGAVAVSVCTALYGIFTTAAWLVALRLVAGLGEAGVFVGAATAAQDRAPDHRRGEASSYFSVAIYGSLAAGPALGEWVFREFGAGTVWLVSSGLVMLGGAIGFAIPADVPDLAYAGPPPTGFFQRDAVLPGAIQLMGLIPLAAFTTFFALYVDELGIDSAGPFFLVYGVSVLVIRLGFARLPDRLGPVRSTFLALTTIGIGTILIGVSSTSGPLYVSIVVFSFGMSMLFPGLFTVAINRAPPSQRTHAVGTFSLFFDLSQGIGPAYLGLLVSIFGVQRAAFLGATVGVVIGLLLTTFGLVPYLRRAAT